MAQLKGVSIEEALGDLVVPRSFHVPMCLQVASRTTQNAVRLFGKASPNLQAECYAQAEGETRFAVVGGLHCERVGEFLHWENSAVAERPQGVSEGFAPVRAGSRGQRNYLLGFCVLRYAGQAQRRTTCAASCTSICSTRARAETIKESHCHQHTEIRTRVPDIKLFCLN